MKKSLSFLVILTLAVSMLLVGCGSDSQGTNTGSQSSETQPTTAELTYPVGGKVDKSQLNESNMYEIYADDDVSHAYPLESFECDKDGTIKSGDINVYDSNHNIIKQTHYEGETLDYTEVREYDEKNQNTKITSYAGKVDRNNLTSTMIMEYDENGNNIKSTTYDDQNKLFSTEKTSYVKYGDTYYTKEDTIYDANNVVTTKTVYSYRSDGIQSKDIRTEYKNGKVNYYMETSYDSEGNAVSYTYYDKNKNVIDEPQDEKDAYGE